MLVKWKQTGNVTEGQFDDLLTLLKCQPDTLLTPECTLSLPCDFRSSVAAMCEGEASKLLELYCYDLCSNPACGVVYRGPYQDLQTCPQPGCGAGRAGSSEQRRRRLYYVSITSWLRLMFGIKDFAQHMQWHSKRIAPTTGDLHDIYDGQLWKELFCGDAQIQTAARGDPEAVPGSPGRNIALAFCSDGVQSTKLGGHSWWPFALQCLNLPPWLRTRLQAFLVCCVVDGKSVNADAQPILELMIDELVYLYYHGVQVQDVSCTRSEPVTVRAMLLDTRFDHPGLYKMFRYLFSQAAPCYMCHQVGMTCACAKPIIPGAGGRAATRCLQSISHTTF